MTLLRVYESGECGSDGYPLAWSSCSGCGGSGHDAIPGPTGEAVSQGPCPGCEAAGSIKDLVHELAGHRCVRCLHPYTCGEYGKGEWSPCDERCTHGPPIRRRQFKRDPWREVDVTPPAMPGELNLRLTAGQRVRMEELVEARWRILTVHHLTGEKRDCRWWNLTALCQRCHLEIQGRVDMHKPYPWEHSEWMRPYVAGFYAWKYGGEELSREETEARLDELLDLGKLNESVERMPV